jgi:hypothetical protein
MKNLYTLFLAALLGLSAFSQKHCGFDAIREAHINAHHLDTQEFDDRIFDRTVQMRQGGGGDQVVIPVVVHVIHQNGAENISLEQVQDGIDALNEAFANAGDYEDDFNVDTGIQFCLAGTDPDGIFTTGVNYVENSLTDVFVPSQELALKDLIRWEPTLYMNIWLVSEITREADNSGVIGFATFPDAHGSDQDGLVIEAAFFGSNFTDTKVIMHEAGHYLGLYHTFQDGCPNDDCLLSGDRVCDTPPDAHVFNTFCFDGTNSCATDDDDLSTDNPFRPIADGGLGDQDDLQINFMDYSSLPCFRGFTEGQKERMNAAVLEYRSSLLEGDRCVSPCESDIDVVAFVDNENVEVNDQVNFANSSGNFTLAEWYVDGVLVASTDEFNISFSVQGEYFVELVLSNDDPGCDEVVTWTIVVSCPITVEITSNGSNVTPGESIDFESTGSGATTYTWFVDNVEVGTGADQTIPFLEPGLFSVYVIANNSACEVQSNVINVSSGSCITGAEANQWYFLNEGGAIFGFDFNTTEMTPITDAPNLGAGHSKACICDENGNLLLVSRGVAIYNSDFEIVQNGSGIDGHISSHYGTIIIKKPLSATEYYVFTSTADFGANGDGVRYSVVDTSLDGGNGAVTAEKNVPIEVSGTEPLTAIRHCNLTDFWLVFYDAPEQGYKAYLVTADGVADDAVFSPVVNSNDVATIAPLRVRPQGDMIAHKELVLNFDNATGTCTLYHEFDLDFSISYDWSPSGKYLYQSTGSLENTVFQFDMTLPVNEIEDDPFSWFFPTLNDLKFFLQRAPDGRLYMEETVNGTIDVLNFPNLPGDASDLVNNAYASNTLLNSFGNYYHAYVDGQSIFIDGPDLVCLGEEEIFGVLNWACILENVTWEVEGTSDWTDLGNGQIAVGFDQVGPVTLTAEVETDCGLVTASFLIEVENAPILSLGPDQSVCVGIPLTLDAGSGWESYNWSTNDETQSIDITATGNYSVTTVLGACEVTDEIDIVSEIAGTIDLGPDFDMCEGEVVVLDIGPEWIDPVWQDGWAGNTYTIYDGGTFSVSTTIPCPASDEIYVDDCGQVITDIETLKTNSSGVVLFPTINAGQFALEFSTMQAQSSTLTIFDSTGRLVSSQTHQVSSGKTKIDLSISVAPGMYLVLVNLDGESHGLRMMIE